MNLSNEQKAYVAALIDGEGTISVSKAKREENRSGYRYNALVVITNTHLEVLNLVKDWTKTGSIQTKTPSKSLIESSSKLRTCYKLVFKHKKAVELLTQIKDYFVIKKENAINVLAFDEYRKSLSSTNYKNYDIEKLNEFYIKSRVLNGANISGRKKYHSWFVDKRKPEVLLTPEVREKVNTKSSKTCSAENCGKKHHSHGLCRVHSRRLKESKSGLVFGRTCRVCSTNIDTLRPDKLYCSLSCKSKYFRKKYTTGSPGA